MRTWIGIAIGILAAAHSAAMGQGPGGRSALSKAADVEEIVGRMMAFDANKDGRLTRSEVSDGRLARLFDRADADRSGEVTKEELEALGAKEHSDVPDFDGPGGQGGFGPPPPPGDVLPARFQAAL